MAGNSLGWLRDSLRKGKISDKTHHRVEAKKAGEKGGGAENSAWIGVGLESLLKNSQARRCLKLKSTKSKKPKVEPRIVGGDMQF